VVLTATSGHTFERSRITWGIYGLVGYFAYLEAVLGPVIPFLRRELQMSFTTAGLHFGAFAAGGLVMGFVGDRIAHLIGRRRMSWGGSAGMALGAIGIALAETPWSTVAMGRAEPRC
jgi:MFS family permease